MPKERDPHVATRDAWKTLPLGPMARIPYNATFSPEEASLLRRGLIPEEMEDKWFIFWEADSLLFHRSWTGHAIYKVDLRLSSNHVEVTRAAVSVDGDHYRRRSDAEEVALLDFLIRGLLLHQAVTFPLPHDLPPEPPGVYQHHVAGTGYPERIMEPARPTWLAHLKRLLGL